MSKEINNQLNTNKDLRKEKILQVLNNNEELLWLDEVNYRKYNFLNIFLFVLSLIFIPSLIGLIFTSFYYIWVYIFNSLNLVYAFLYLISSLILSFSLFLIIRFINNIKYYIYGFGFTNERLIFLKIRSFGGGVDGEIGNLYYSPFFANIKEINSFENLDSIEGDFVKFRINSVFYEFSSNKKRIINNLTSREIFLDEEGLELLTKLIKEQSPNANIKI